MLAENKAIDAIALFAESHRKDGEDDRYTTVEFQKLRNLLKESRSHLIFEPRGGPFGLFLYVYQHPPYPDSDPILLMRISGRHIPLGSSSEEKFAGGPRLDYQFRELSPFSHTKENKEYLKKHTLQLPYDFDFYST